MDQYDRKSNTGAFLPKVEITLYIEDLRVEEVLEKTRHALARWSNGRRQNLRYAGDPLSVNKLTVSNSARCASHSSKLVAMSNHNQNRLKFFVQF